MVDRVVRCDVCVARRTRRARQHSLAHSLYFHVAAIGCAPEPHDQASQRHMEVVGLCQPQSPGQSPGLGRIVRDCEAQTEFDWHDFGGDQER